VTALVRSVAFYLPQFHPIPENDEWWGAGFTEWTNVVRAKRYFQWQRQPRIPADLGFYDLRLEETRIAQAELASRYGIEAFCYYHYWFCGRKLLERPFAEVLSSGRPTLSFCLCWANEDWTQAWSGGSRGTLLQQQYSADDHLNHARALVPVFADPRYLRVEGRPVFLVYRAASIPDPQKATRTWREVARAEGLGDLLLLRVDSFPNERSDPRPSGFDAAVEFQPDFYGVWADRRTPTRRWIRRVRRIPEVYPYRRLVTRATTAPNPTYPRFPCVTPGWDNTPRRREEGLVLKGATPEAFGHWTSTTVQRLVAGEPERERRLLFVNAWNEWAEGNYLEPDRTWGHRFLQAHLDAVSAPPPFN